MEYSMGYAETANDKYKDGAWWPTRKQLPIICGYLPPHFIPDCFCRKVTEPGRNLQKRPDIFLSSFSDTPRSFELILFNTDGICTHIRAGLFIQSETNFCYKLRSINDK